MPDKMPIRNSRKCNQNAWKNARTEHRKIQTKCLPKCPQETFKYKNKMPAKMLITWK